MAFDWKKLLQFAAPVVGGVIGGPAGAAVGGALGGAIQGGKPSEWIPNAAIGAGLGYGGAKLGGVQGQGFSNTLKNPLSAIGSAFSNINPFKSGTAYAAQTPQSLLSYLSPFGLLGQTGSNPILPSKAGTSQESSSGGLFGGLNKASLIGPLLGLGSQLIRSPKVPELPQSVINFQNTASQGNPLQNQAQAAIQRQLAQTQQNLGQPEIDALTRQYDLAYDQEKRQIDALYKSLRPGTDPLTDSSYQRDLSRLNDKYAQLKAESVATAQRGITNDYNAQQAQAIAQAAGLSQQQLQQLATLGQYDLDRQLSQLNIDYQDKSTLRNYLLQLGGNIFASQYQQNPLDQLLSGLGR